MAKQPNSKALTKKHLARLERERIQRRYLLIATAVVLVLVVALILYGVLDQTILKRVRPVAKVGSETISSGEFIDEVRFDRLRSIQQLQSLTADPTMLQFFGSYVMQIGSRLQSPITLGQSVLDSMIEDILVKNEAKERGIELSDAEIDQEVERQFGFFENGTPTPTLTVTPFTYSTSTLSPTQLALVPPTATAAPTSDVTPTPGETAAPEASLTPDASPTAGVELTPTSEVSPTITLTPTITPTPTAYTRELFEDQVDTYLQNADAIKLSRNQLRNFITRQLLKTRVQEAIGAEVKAVDEQVWARHILVATEEEAKAVLDRLNAGEKFEVVAAELSLDTSNKDSGGDLQWFSHGQMVPAFSDAAFALEIGEISQPVQSEFGYHIIQALGHEERPLTPDQVTSAKTAAYQSWLEEAKAAASVETYDRWMDIVPTDPEIPVAVQQVLESLSQSQQQ